MTGTRGVSFLSAGGLALALAVTVGVGRCPAQRARPLDRVRFLIVVDTSDPNLRAAVLKDRQNLKRTLEELIPPDRYTVDELVGDNLTKDKIYAYYQKLKTGPNEGLVFYFSGHGATLPDSDMVHRQQVLALGYIPKQRDAVVVPRENVMNAMRFKNAGLAVMLTDCCANHVVLSLPPQITTPAPLGARAGFEEKPREIAPVVRNLFFEARGVIDVTASDHDVAGCDPDAGSFFTLALTKLLKDDVASFNPLNKDLLRWNDFFPRLRKETNDEMQYYSKKRGGDGARTQYAKAFQLGGEANEVNRPKWRFGVQAQDNDGDGVYCRRVFPDTPAASAGLADGDVILVINDKTIKSRADFAYAIDISDGAIKVVFRKANGERLTREVKLDPLD
jgi:hypothetical protein